MIKKCCDICQQEVNDNNYTQITLRDKKAISYNWWGFETGVPRKWKGIICDKCLKEFRRQGEVK